MSAAPRGPSRSGRVLDWFERRLNLSELFSFVTHFGFVWTPVDTARPVRQVLADAKATPNEPLAVWPRALNLVMVLAFALEVVTGTLLAFHYQPATGFAHESTQRIVRDIPFGWLLHQLHAWGAWVLVAAAVLRLGRLFWSRLYREPRELLWMAAVALVTIAFAADFTGRLLTWDARSYWAIVRGLEVVTALPVFGAVVGFLIGGQTVDDGVLIRFYVMHVVVLPVWFAGCVYLTFATLRRVGLGPVGVPTTPVTSRQHGTDLGVLLLGLFGLLVALAVLLPFPFRDAADPYATPPGVRPPWYLLAPYALMQGLRLPAWIPGLLFVAAALALISMPLWARHDADPARERRLRLAAFAVILAWLALSLLGLFLEGRP